MLLIFIFIYLANFCVFHFSVNFSLVFFCWNQIGLLWCLRLFAVWATEPFFVITLVVFIYVFLNVWAKIVYFLDFVVSQPPTLSFPRELDTVCCVFVSQDYHIPQSIADLQPPAFIPEDEYKAKPVCSEGKGRNGVPALSNLQWFSSRRIGVVSCFCPFPYFEFSTEKRLPNDVITFFIKLFGTVVLFKQIVDCIGTHFLTKKKV